MYSDKNLLWQEPYPEETVAESSLEIELHNLQLADIGWIAQTKQNHQPLYTPFFWVFVVWINVQGSSSHELDIYRGMTMRGSLEMCKGMESMKRFLFFFLYQYKIAWMDTLV